MAHVFINIHAKCFKTMLPLCGTFTFVVFESFCLTMTITINTTQILIVIYFELQFTFFPFKHSFQVVISDRSVGKKAIRNCAADLLESPE